jgi:hypothetical protein
VAYKLKVDVPSSPPGELIEVAGLGAFENGSESDLSDEQASNFRSHHQRSYIDDTGEMVTELGPTLGKANFQEGVSVSTAKGGDK